MGIPDRERERERREREREREKGVAGNVGITDLLKVRCLGLACLHTQCNRYAEEADAEND